MPAHTIRPALRCLPADVGTTIIFFNLKGSRRQPALRDVPGELGNIKSGAPNGNWTPLLRRDQGLSSLSDVSPGQRASLWRAGCRDCTWGMLKGGPRWECVGRTWVRGERFWVTAIVCTRQGQLPDVVGILSEFRYGNESCRCEGRAEGRKVATADLHKAIMFVDCAVVETMRCNYSWFHRPLMLCRGG